MALIEEIEQLRSQCIAALEASHNYYSHTKHAWRFVQEAVRQGHTLSLRNQVTGNTVDGPMLSSLSQGYVTNELTSATFQHFVSLFDDFVNGFLRAWLTEHPDSLSDKQLKFQSVLDSADKNEIVQFVIQKKVNDIAYDGVKERFIYLESIANLGCPNQECLDKLVEIKASRDILVHSKGIANSLYVKKSKNLSRYKEGQKLEIPDDYHLESWQFLNKVVNDIADAGLIKARK